MNWLVKRMSTVPSGGKKSMSGKGKIRQTWFRRFAAWLIAQLPERLAGRLLRDFDLNC